MKTLKITSILFTFFSVNIMLAQQDPNFTLYNFNMNVINPAYAGINDKTEINLAYRSQFLGVPNAPSTQTLTFATPLQKNLGIGISIVNDEVFVLKETDVAVDISYKLQLNETHKLYFGLKAGGGFVNIDLNKAGALAGDPLFSQNQSFFNPHIGAGVHLKHEKYYFTLSTPNFLNGKRYEKQGNRPIAAVDNVHLYLGGGYTFTINQDFKVTPAVMMRHVTGAPNSYDISSTLAMYDKVQAGVNYRTDEMVSIYSLFNFLNKRVRVGFAYDFTISDAKQVTNDGSLEFILKYKFN